MTETYVHNGHAFVIRRDDAGKAVAMLSDVGNQARMSLPLRLEWVERSRAALAAYLADPGDFASVRDAITKTARAVAALPPVDLGPVESDPPQRLADAKARAARFTRYLDEHPEVDATITHWHSLPTGRTLTEFKPPTHNMPRRERAPLPTPPVQGHASEASRTAASRVFDVARGPAIGDESVPCPSCGTPTIIVSLIHDESISQCPQCSQPKAPK